MLLPPIPLECITGTPLKALEHAPDPCAVSAWRISITATTDTGGLKAWQYVMVSTYHTAHGDAVETADSGRDGRPATIIIRHPLTGETHRYYTAGTRWHRDY